MITFTKCNLLNVYINMKYYVLSEFVQWLVENKEAKSVDEAVMLGQALLDCGILHHGKCK